MRLEALVVGLLDFHVGLLLPFLGLEHGQGGQCVSKNVWTSVGGELVHALGALEEIQALVQFAHGQVAFALGSLYLR